MTESFQEAKISGSKTPLNNFNITEPNRNTMNDDSFVIRRTKDYYLKPLLFLFASFVVFIILQMVFVAEIIAIPEQIETNTFFILVYLIASLLLILIFIVSLVVLITALFVTLPRWLTVKEDSVIYHGIKGTIIIPRAELASVRFAQESSDDIKKNRGTLYLRSVKNEIINFGRFDNLSKIAPIMREYVKDRNFNAVKEYYS